MFWLFKIVETSRPYKDLGAEVWDGALGPGERLLWTGRPARGPRLTEIAAGIIGVAIAGNSILALVFFSATPAGGSLPQVVVALIGLMSIIFFAMPIVFIWVESWMRNFLYYCVTDRRALILDTQGGPPYRLTAYPIEPGMELSMSRGRMQTLWFKPPVTTAFEKPRLTTYFDPQRLEAGVCARAQARAQMTYDSSAPKAFRFLEDAEAVRDLIRHVAEWRGPGLGPEGPGDPPRRYPVAR